MKNKVQGLIIAMVSLLSTAFGVDHATEEVLSRYIKLGEELVPVLSAARDATGAEKAAPALQALLPRVMDSGRELKAVASLSEEDSRQLRAKFERPMRETWGKVYDEIYRLQRVRCYECVSFFRSFSILCSLLEG